MNVLRYQPRPPWKNPVPAVVPPVGVGRSSMLQSCGRSSARHEESSKPGSAARANAPVGSVAASRLTSANRQSASKSLVRAAFAAGAIVATIAIPNATALHSTRIAPASLRDSPGARLIPPPGRDCNEAYAGPGRGAVTTSSSNCTAPAPAAHRWQT